MTVSERGATRFLLMAGMIAASLGAAIPCLAAPDAFGRLFYTPAQRAQLENARARNATQPAGASSRGTPVEESAPLRFDGVMIRSDGKATHWVNGKPQRNGSGVPGLKPGQIRADDRVYEPYQVLRPVAPRPSESDLKAPTP